MRDPVIAMDSYTYERAAIESHMRQTPAAALPLSPISGEPLPSRALIPNRLARDFIQHMYDLEDY